jgi:serine-protein kinase ATM
VEHSSPFGDFIIDKHARTPKGTATRIVGAHSRYFPTEWSSDQCRNAINHVWQENQQPHGSEIEAYDELQRKNKLREAFDEICANHSPVFRYFFVENFLNPETWYASKMRYTRSVAVSSIVGHILGIGTFNFRYRKQTLVSSLRFTLL